MDTRLLIDELSRTLGILVAGRPHAEPFREAHTVPIVDIEKTAPGAINEKRLQQCVRRPCARSPARTRRQRPSTPDAGAVGPRDPRL